MTSERESVSERAKAAWSAVSAAFASLGRICIALDASFRVRQVCEGVEGLLGAGVRELLIGREAGELFGQELLGPGGSLREALITGERRERVRTLLNPGNMQPRLVSVTAAPISEKMAEFADPLARYLLVLRPAEDEAISLANSISGLVARSEAMTKVVRLIENLQQSDATVLVTGEVGTGKEVVARALHAHSPRRSGPFVSVNCSAIPADLLDSELFGHVPGAFPGAVKERVGRVEVASGGTLFLAEISDMPLALQAKLLRLLQERSFERLGDSETRTADIRIIAATHSDLRPAVTAGTFREDLYYRLRVVPIDLPPLRQRREDTEPLSRYLLARVCNRHGRDVRLSPDALRAILAYDWPGNVRELESALEYALSVAKGQTIVPEDLPEEVFAGLPQLSNRVNGEVAYFDDPHERERLRNALEAHGWRRDETAHALGMSRTTLWRKMRELGLGRGRPMPTQRQ